jgi:hypothetical protein
MKRSIDRLLDAWHQLRPVLFVIGRMVILAGLATVSRSPHGLQFRKNKMPSGRTVSIMSQKRCPLAA